MVNFVATDEQLRSGSLRSVRVICLVLSPLIRGASSMDIDADEGRLRNIPRMRRIGHNVA